MNNGTGIIFHSGAYDRVNHGLSIAVAALAMGYDVKMFFTHLSLFHLLKDERYVVDFSEKNEFYVKRYRKFLGEGHIQSIRSQIEDCKKLGGVIYVCPASMALLNISRDELIPEVNGSLGITAFLAEIEGFQTFFI